jgi:hypothetical protein
MNLEDITKTQYKRIIDMGDKYEKDIGGLDMGFGGILYITKYVDLMLSKDNPIGFILGTNAIEAFPDEKSFYPTAVYISPKYRNKTGKHKNVLNNALIHLVNSLEENNFDRLKVFPQFPGMVTDIGHKKVLKPLHEILVDRAKKDHEEGDRPKYINPAEGTGFDPIFLFDPEGFVKKLKK